MDGSRLVAKIQNRTYKATEYWWRKAWRELELTGRFWEGSFRRPNEERDG